MLHREQQLPVVAAIFAALTLVSIFTIDGVGATSLATLAPGMKSTTNGIVHAFELVFLFPVSKFATGAVMLVIAAALAFVRRYRRVSWALVLIGVAQLSTRLIAGVLKNVFGRLRPYEALADGRWDDRFFAGGSSFPSGHAAHFWGLYYALAILFPRLRWWLLPVPLFVSAARILVNDHYVSDTLGSAAIAALVTWALAKAFLHRARNASPA